MPFTLRALETERSRFGIMECLNHSLLHPYPVLHERATELARSNLTSCCLCVVLSLHMLHAHPRYVCHICWLPTPRHPFL